MGRPTALTPVLKLQLIDYISNFHEHGHIVPSISGFAVVSGVSRSALHDWKQKGDDAEYSDIYDQLMARQEVELLNGGLIKKFAPQIAALALGKHGYSTRTDHTSSDGSMAHPITTITRRVVSDDS